MPFAYAQGVQAALLWAAAQAALGCLAMRGKRITYLAGPINGCTDDEANTWREIVMKRLGIENCKDPMVRDYRGKEDESVNEIVELDKQDILECQVMLANCWQVSWGTAMEILFAYEHGIPVFSVLPPGARVSPWLRYHATVTTSLDEALQQIINTPSDESNCEFCGSTCRCDGVYGPPRSGGILRYAR